MFGWRWILDTTQQVVLFFQLVPAAPPWWPLPYMLKEIEQNMKAFVKSQSAIFQGELLFLGVCWMTENLLKQTNKLTSV